MVLSQKIWIHNLHSVHAAKPAMAPGPSLPSLQHYNVHKILTMMAYTPLFNYYSLWLSIGCLEQASIYQVQSRDLMQLFSLMVLMQGISPPEISHSPDSRPHCNDESTCITCRDWFIRGNLTIPLRMTAAKCRLNIRGSFTEVPMCSAEVGHSTHCTAFTMETGTRIIYVNISHQIISIFHNQNMASIDGMNESKFSQSKYGEYRWYE